MKVLVQNLQKRAGLATRLSTKYKPDVSLVQEINFNSETYPFEASTLSSMGYGTAIGSSSELNEIKHVKSPHKETGGFIVKKTTIATINSVQFISFHGFNGQPFKNKDKLVAHVEAVLAVLNSGLPALFAGDFNTWTKDHLHSVTTVLEKEGFSHAFSWPYTGRDEPLDHAFVRGLTVNGSQYYSCESDHNGAILELQVGQGWDVDN